ncbi:diguanylate cyclase domain-containing protein [Aquincola tertiaricarbonis]|uniref:diguanylate cyclase domain-containing protein n=1 Tax=Aquincola tertiaricarbonis TaxID=391953 RepID=UPI0006151C25|nr:diguanylate cyclase [Aquincola tertiaricarbonis]
MTWRSVFLFRTFGPLSLRLRLSIGVVGVVLAISIGLATSALYFVKRHMQASIAQEQFERMSGLADAVDQKFISRRVLLRNFALSAQTHRFSDASKLQAFLVAHENALRESFDNVSFLDLHGELVANLNGSAPIGKLNIADREYFIDTFARRAGVISAPYRNRFSGLAQVAVTQPVLDEQGAVRWIVSGSINLAEENFLGELARVKFGRTGYMFILNTKGIVIDHPQKDRILKHIDALGGRNPATARAVAGLEGTTEGMNRVGVYGLYAFKRTAQTDWILGGIYPRAEAFESIDRIERLAWAGAVVLTLLAGLLTLAVLNWQLSPLTRLHEHMKRSHLLASYVPYPGDPSQPEIRDMVRTFDALMLQREKAQAELKARKDRVRSILTHAADAFVSIDEAGAITEWNRQAERTFGWLRDEVLGKTMRDLLIPEAVRPAHKAGFDRFLHTGTGPIVDHRIEVMALHKDGHSIPVELSVAAVRQGNVYVANAFLRDITERRQAQADLAASEKRVRDITNHVPALIGYFDADLRMHFANEPATRLFNLRADREYDMRTALGEPTFLEHAPYLDEVLGGQEVSFEAASALGDGGHYQAHLVPDRETTGEVKGFYVMTFDVTKLKRAEQKLLELSRVDALTQLPNRRWFQERLDDALARSQRSGRALALMYLDIDGFKQINDAHGHGVGDEVLVVFAARLKSVVRITDTVARLAGDEFVIILEGLHQAEESRLVARKIIASMQEPMRLKSHRLVVTSSVGVAAVDAVASDHESAFARLNQLTAEALIAQADQALYEAKRAGRNTFSLLHT